MERCSYPLSDIAVVIKRHTHDVRNALNGMELELTLLEESATNPAARDAVKRLRKAGVEISRLMHGLSSKYSTEPPCVIPALQIAERWNADARHVVSAVPPQWNMQLTGELVWVEEGLIRTLLMDVLEISARISGKCPLLISCRRENNRAVFEISVTGGKVNTRIIDSQQFYWTALRGLGERGQILMRPETLDPEGSFPMVLSLPLHHSAIGK